MGQVHDVPQITCGGHIDGGRDEGYRDSGEKTRSAPSIKDDHCRIPRRNHGIWATIQVMARWWSFTKGAEHFSDVGGAANSKFPPRTHFISPDPSLDIHLRHTTTSIPSDIMAPSRWHSRPAWLLSLLALFSLLCPTSALYFHLDGTTPKCFYEELPKDTLVVGR
jgi:hypothetical protein